MSDGTLRVNPSITATVAPQVLRYIPRSRTTVVDDSTSSANAPWDFLARDIPVCFGLISALANSASQKTLQHRLRSAKLRDLPLICLVMCDIAEPSLDVLTWLNDVSVAVGATLLLSWSYEEVAVMLEGLADSASTSSDVIGARREEEGMPALVDFLTTCTTGAVNKTDALRIGNRYNTVAEMLVGIEADTVAKIPGVGPKKASRLVGVLNAEFPVTRRRIDDVVGDRVDDAETQQQSSTEMQAALNRIRQREDEEEEELL